MTEDLTRSAGIYQNMFCIFAMTKYLDDIEITLTLCVTVVMVDSNRSKRVNEFISLQDI